MLKTALPYRPSVWFVTVFFMFFGRGILNASWTSRGPEVRDMLDVSIADMGVIATVFAAGAIIGVMFSGRIVEQYGSRTLAVATYILMPLSLIGAALGLQAGSVVITSIALFFFGLPFGAADFGANIEASELDRASKKSKLPMLHGGYSIGVLVGALITSLLILVDVPVGVQLMFTAVIVGGFVLYRVSGLPAHHGKHPDHASVEPRVRIAQTPAGRRRTILVSIIAFIFVFAEGAAAVFIPLALAEAGRSPAEAAFAYTLYSLGMAFARVVGGKVVDRIGRRAVVLYSAIVCAVGVGIFAFAPYAPVEYIGGLLWGLGGSLSIAMSVSAVSDNKATLTKAQSTLWIWVYFANLGVGPVLGGISIVTGIFGSFLIPVVMLAGAAVLSSVTKPDPEVVK
jgi:MFS family permease